MERFFIPSPVGAGHFGQMKSLDHSGGRNVRSSAQIRETPLCIKRNLFIFQIVDQLDLVLLFQVAERIQRRSGLTSLFGQKGDLYE